MIMINKLLIKKTKIINKITQSIFKKKVSEFGVSRNQSKTALTMIYFVDEIFQKKLD